MFQVSASSTVLGVTTSTCCRIAPIVSSGSTPSAPPTEAWRTGSHTTNGRSSFGMAPRKSRMAAALSELPSAPILIAAGGRSSPSALSCALTVEAGTTWLSVSAVVFWAVTQVTTLAPCRPKSWKVRTSAWIPAPPPLSDPAIVQATWVMSGSIERGKGPSLEPSADAVLSPSLVGGVRRWSGAAVVPERRADHGRRRFGGLGLGHGAGPVGDATGLHGMCEGAGHFHGVVGAGDGRIQQHAIEAEFQRRAAAAWDGSPIPASTTSETSGNRARRVSSA